MKWAQHVNKIFGNKYLVDIIQLNIYEHELGLRKILMRLDRWAYVQTP